MGKSRKLADLGGSEAVKLWSGLVYCNMYLFKGGQVHLQYMIQIVKFPGFWFQISVATWRGVRDIFVFGKYFTQNLNMLGWNLNLAFSISSKIASCEHLGKSMRSSITQYVYIFDMQWNQSCLLTRRVLSHKTQTNIMKRVTLCTKILIFNWFYTFFWTTLIIRLGIFVC